MADKSLIGRSLGVTTCEVEKGRLRFFAKAIGETDPVYTDEAAARAAGHRSLPVPPSFLMCLEAEGRDTDHIVEDIFGFDLGRILHAEQGFDYHAMAYAGDVLTFATEVLDVYQK
jgi:acyl dehydratase